MPTLGAESSMCTVSVVCGSSSLPAASTDQYSRVWSASPLMPSVVAHCSPEPETNSGG